MVDFHTHILPGIDDGSKDIDETIRLLRMQYEQGVTKIVLTPHFYAGEMSADKFLSRRKKSYELVEAKREQEPWIPELFLGAEVYYFPGMGDADILPQLCIAGTDILLLEMPFAQWTSSICEDVKKMIYKRKLTVVLAHVERYAEFQLDKTYWNRIMDYPVILQFNAGALRSWKKKRLIFRFLKQEVPMVVGSDTHNCTSRRPNLEEGRQIVRKKFGDNVWTQMHERMERMLKSCEEREAP